MRKNKKCLFEEDHETMAFSDGKCFSCGKKVCLTYAENLAAKVDAVPLETRQKLIDALHEGKNIGQAREIAGIEDLMVACEIINKNINHYDFLRTKAV